MVLELIGAILASVVFFVLPVAVILALWSVKIVNQWERGVVLTMGKYSSTMEPGVNFTIPILQTFIRVDMRIRTTDVAKQEIMTKDNVPLLVNAVVYFKVKVPEDAVIEIQDYSFAVAQLTQAALRNVIGNYELDSVLTQPDKIAEAIKDVVDKDTNEWGVDITGINIQEIELPAEMKRAMAKQAESERERRAMIIKSQGELSASENLSKAAGDALQIGGRAALAHAADDYRHCGGPEREDNHPRAKRLCGGCGAASRAQKVRRAEMGWQTGDELEEAKGLGGIVSALRAAMNAGGGKLDEHERYLQVAFNGNFNAAISVIRRLPRSDRILVEAGTPFIKRYGAGGISGLKRAWGGYVVADMKTTDGGAQEVEIVASAGANGITALGNAPSETLGRFITACRESEIDSIIDKIGVADPLRVLMPLVRNQPDVVELHKGRDEETTRGKVIEYRHVKRVKSKFDVIISAAGVVDLKQAQTASFNGANIVVVNVVEPGQEWTGLDSQSDVPALAKKFLDTIS